MGFVLGFHNASASTAVSLKKFQIFFPRNTINMCAFRRKHTLTLSIFTMRAREVHFCFYFYDCKLHARLKPFQKLHTESQLGPIDKSLSQNQSRSYYNDKVPWGCRRFQSWKGSATRIPWRSNPGLREVSPMGIELSILRLGLVNQSQE